MKLIIRWLALTVAFWAAASIVPGISIDGGIGRYFWIALLFGLINAILGTVLRLITLPLAILTFGLFLLVVNTLMLTLTDKVSDVLTIDGFWSAFFGALIISLLSSVLASVLGKVAR